MEEKQIWPSNNHAVSTPLELVPKLTRVACVIQCGGIWFANGKFGVTWKLFQAVVKPPQSLKGTCHIKLSSNDRERMASQTTSGHQDASEEDDDVDDSAVGLQVQVQDSDDEGSQPPPPQQVTSSVSEAAEAAEETVTRKKVVRRKKNGSEE